MRSERRDEAKSRFLSSFTNTTEHLQLKILKQHVLVCTYINTYELLENTVAQMNQQTIVIVLLLTDNIISLRRSVLNKQMWDYSYMNKNKTQINVDFLFMTELLDVQQYFNVILFHTFCRSLPRALNK